MYRSNNGRYLAESSDRQQDRSFIESRGIRDIIPSSCLIGACVRKAFRRARLSWLESRWDEIYKKNEYKAAVVPWSSPCVVLARVSIVMELFRQASSFPPPPQLAFLVSTLYSNININHWSYHSMSMQQDNRTTASFSWRGPSVHIIMQLHKNHWPSSRK